MVDHLRAGLRQGDHGTVFGNLRLRYLALIREPLLFLKVAQFAMYRHQNLGPDPLIHFHQLFSTRVAGYMDETVPLRDDVDAHTGKLVLDPANREFVPRNFP